MPMRPCKVCLNNDWNYKFEDETQMVVATCKRCQTSVRFPAKKKAYEKRDTVRPWCEYEMRDDGVYLRTFMRDEFIKVGIKKGYQKGKPYLQVVPIQQANFNPMTTGKIL